MAIYLGSQSVSVYLGTSEVTVPGVYIGGLQVFPTGPTVPGAPTWSIYYTTGSATVLEFYSPPDGGLPITGYNVYIDGDILGAPDSSTQVGSLVSRTYDADYSGLTAEVAAVNAIGEGAKSVGVVLASP